MNLEHFEKGDSSEHRLANTELGFDPDKLIETSDEESFPADDHSGFDPDKLIGGEAESLETESQDIDGARSDSAENVGDIDEPELMSTKEQRLNIIGTKADWTGEPGESAMIPKDQDARDSLREYGLDGIEYRNAIPDFRPVSEASVQIDMTSDRPSNFSQADKKCAEQWSAESRDGRSDWKACEVRDWRRENKYTWHECSDQKTCELVPSEIHGACRHAGGVYECKLREQAENGGVFDE